MNFKSVFFHAVCTLLIFSPSNCFFSHLHMWRLWQPQVPVSYEITLRYPWLHVLENKKNTNVESNLYRVNPKSIGFFLNYNEANYLVTCIMTYIHNNTSQNHDLPLFYNIVCHLSHVKSFYSSSMLYYTYSKYHLKVNV